MKSSKTIGRDKRIAIIGAGPAGLSTAYFLQKNGYKNVTVLEKLGRVGGLCKSITVDGMSYDLGANYVTWAYKETLKLAKEVGATTYQELPYESLKIQPDGKPVFRDVIEAILTNPYTQKKIPILSFVWTAIRYAWIRLRLGSTIDPPDSFARIDERPDLCVPFKEWLEANRLIDLATLFEIPITIMGYGQLSDIATPYALRYMSLRTFLPMLLTRVPVVKLLFPWPRRFTLGFQRLWESVSWRTNVRLSVNITSIERSALDGSILIKFETPDQDLNKIERVKEEMEFDYLVLACPLTEDVFARLKLKMNDNERRIAKAIKISEYCMTTFWIDNLQTTAPITVVLPLPPAGRPWAMTRQFQAEGNHFTQFYTQSDANQSKESVIAEVTKMVSALGGKIDDSKWHTFDRFTYFQHVETDEFANGFYRKLAAAQGYDRTFYVGGLTDFELVEPIVEYSKLLVEKYFLAR